MKTTLKSEGYAYLFYDVNQCHVLYNINTGEIERYINTPNFAGYTLKYKNTRLEFCFSYSETETAQLLRYMLKVQRWGEQHPLAHSTMMNVYRNYIAN